MVVGCKVSIVDEVFANYEIQEMLSSKKALKVRQRGLEMLVSLFLGILKLRRHKTAQG